jgi:hypothetical protein
MRQVVPEPLRSKDIPDEFFAVVSLFVPALNAVAQQECDIDFGSLLVLFNIKLKGKRLERGLTVLRQDLTTLLLKRGFSEAGVTRTVETLQNRHLVERFAITPEVREDLFGPGGNKLAVAITPAGEGKLEEFKKALRMHFASWLARQPLARRIWLRTLLPQAIELARELIRWGTRY